MAAAAIPLTPDAVEQLKLRIETGIQELAVFQDRVAVARHGLKSNPDLGAEHAEWLAMDPAGTLREAVTQGWRFMFRVGFLAVGGVEVFGNKAIQDEYHQLCDDVARWDAAVAEYHRIIAKAMRRLTGKKLLGKVASLTRRAVGSRHHSHSSSSSSSSSPHGHHGRQEQEQQHQVDHTPAAAADSQHHHQEYTYQPQPVQYPADHPRRSAQRQPSDLSLSSTSSSSSSWSAQSAAGYAPAADDGQDAQRKRERLRNHILERSGLAPPVGDALGGGAGAAVTPRSRVGRANTVRRPQVSVVAVSSSTMIESGIPENFGERAYVGVGRVVM